MAKTLRSCADQIVEASIRAVLPDEAVRRALESVRAAKEALLGGMTPDVVLTEVEQAQTALGELTGRTAREDMVARIFERFCVGK